MARNDPGPAPGAGSEGGTPRAKRRRLRWTEQRRKRFVLVLAHSYDTDAALQAADLSWPEVCELRVRYPEFAARIDEVIVAGFDRLEAALLRAAAAALATAKPDMALVQAVMKLRRPARAATAPVKLGAREQAERARRVDRIMSKFAQLHAAQSEGGGHGHDGNGRSAPGLSERH